MCINNNGGVIMDDIEQLRKQLMNNANNPTSPERLDHISMFLEPTKVTGQEVYDNERKLLRAKELSCGNIKEAHMTANIKGIMTSNIILGFGQVNLYRIMTTTIHAGFKMSMSIDGEFIKRITGQEFKYTYTQHMHEHQDNVKNPKTKGE